MMLMMMLMMLIVSFQWGSSDDDCMADFNMQVMQIERDHMEIPEQHTKVFAKLPSVEFQKICQDVNECCVLVQVRTSKEGIAFSVQRVITINKIII